LLGVRTRIPAHRKQITPKVAVDAGSLPPPAGGKKFENTPPNVRFLFSFMIDCAYGEQSGFTGRNARDTVAREPGWWVLSLVGPANGESEQIFGDIAIHNPRMPPLLSGAWGCFTTFRQHRPPFGCMGLNCAFRAGGVNRSVSRFRPVAPTIPVNAKMGHNPPM
jgi:hypothetical protein